MANTIDMDALFNGATVTLNTVQNTVDAVANGINDIRNATNSRRNTGQYQQPNQGYNGYTAPVSYGYGYSDTGYGGYGYPNRYPSYQGMNNFGGYPGFTNPGYGNTAGASPTPNRPQGGAWG